MNYNSIESVTNRIEEIEGRLEYLKTMKPSDERDGRQWELEDSLTFLRNLANELILREEWEEAQRYQQWESARDAGIPYDDPAFHHPDEEDTSWMGEEVPF